MHQCAEEGEHLSAGAISELLCPFCHMKRCQMQGDTAAVTWCCTQSYTDWDVRSTVTLPTLVRKQRSHRYPLGCPQEIHTPELDIRVVHKWKSIDLASARDFLNNRFSETHAICKVCPEVIQTGPWLLNLSAHQEQLFSTFFSLGGPCISYQWRSGLLVYLNLLTSACFPQLLPPSTGTARSTGTDNHCSRPSLQLSFF